MILFYLKIEFLSLVYLLVYIGAIPILFLFVLLMFPIYNFSEKSFYKLNIYFISLIKLNILYYYNNECLNRYYKFIIYFIVVILCFLF